MWSKCHNIRRKRNQRDRTHDSFSFSEIFENDIVQTTFRLIICEGFPCTIGQSACLKNRACPQARNFTQKWETFRSKITSSVPTAGFQLDLAAPVHPSLEGSQLPSRHLPAGASRSLWGYARCFARSWC